MSNRITASPAELVAPPRPGPPPAPLVALALLLATTVTVQAQWPAPTSVYQQTVRHRWMNTRQSPAFTPWAEARPQFVFDSARRTPTGTTLHLSPRIPQGQPPSVLEFSGDQVGRGAVSGPNSVLAWDLIPSFRPAQLIVGARWVDTVDQTSTQPGLTTHLAGTRVSRLVRDTLVKGVRFWWVSDTLRGAYQEVVTHHERTLYADVTIERNTEGVLVGEYLIDPSSRFTPRRTDTGSFHGTATLRYPDGSVFPTTTTFERVRRIGGHSREEFDSLAAEARRNAPRFSMFIEPSNELERRLGAGDLTLRDSLLGVLDQSRDVYERSGLRGMLALWARGSGTQPFADTLRAHLLMAGDTALVVNGLLDPIQTMLTTERLALILPFVQDPGLAFAWGVSAGRFYENVAQRFSEYPPAVEQPPYRQLCTPEACAQLAALSNAEGDPRLRQAAFHAAIASDPLPWIDSVRPDRVPRHLFNLIRGVGATWSASSQISIPGAEDLWQVWVEWMNGRALSDSVVAGARAPSLRFEDSHRNAAAFSELLSGRDLSMEWENGAAQARSAMERFVFERMLAGRGRWHPEVDSVVAWLEDGTGIGFARGLLGAPRVLADAPLPDSATATSLIDRILASELDGEAPWELVRPRPAPNPGGAPGSLQLPPPRGWGGRGHTIYVVTPIVTEELRARWGARVTWITDPEWRLTDEMSPAVVITISGIGARGTLAKISASVASFRKEGEYTNRSLSGDSYLLLRTTTGWRRVGGDSWVV
ncbi:MAG: hypothetical protein ABR551_11950 [Gemmatimonadales bacterium]